MEYILNDHSSRSFYIKAGVSKGFIFGPTLFLVSFNHLADVIDSVSMLVTQIINPAFWQV